MTEYCCNDMKKAVEIDETIVDGRMFVEKHGKNYPVNYCPWCGDMQPRLEEWGDTG